MMTSVQTAGARHAQYITEHTENWETIKIEDWNKMVRHGNLDRMYKEDLNRISFTTPHQELGKMVTMERHRIYNEKTEKKTGHKLGPPLRRIDRMYKEYRGRISCSTGLSLNLTDKMGAAQGCQAGGGGQVGRTSESYMEKEKQQRPAMLMND